MSEERVVRELFDRWERVWHEGQYQLVPECVAEVYIRHDEFGTRRVTPEEYAAEIAAAHKERPNTRFIVFDHEIAGDRAWFRFNLTWTDAQTGDTRTRAGMQVYRVERGKLADTWLPCFHSARRGPTPLGRSIGRARLWPTADSRPRIAPKLPCRWIRIRPLTNAPA